MHYPSQHVVLEKCETHGRACWCATGKSLTYTCLCWAKFVHSNKSHWISYQLCKLCQVHSDKRPLITSSMLSTYFVTRLRKENVNVNIADNFLWFCKADRIMIITCNTATTEIKVSIHHNVFPINFIHNWAKHYVLIWYYLKVLLG